MVGSVCTLLVVLVASLVHRQSPLANSAANSGTSPSHLTMHRESEVLVHIQRKANKTTSAMSLGLTSHRALTDLGALWVVKSPNDQKEYRSIVLDNNMQALLVSDASTDKAACALSVQVYCYNWLLLM